MQAYTGDKENLGKCEQVNGILLQFTPFSPLKETFYVYMAGLALMIQQKITPSVPYYKSFKVLAHKLRNAINIICFIKNILNFPKLPFTLSY